jgi:thiosulfate/3-mercaptopyruvate sulfurtransferase
MDVLVTADWLAARIEEPQLRIVDCRFELGDPAAGHALYRAGHIPGAVFLDLDDDLSAPPGAPDRADPRGPVGGRHPLPQLDRFAAAVRGAGIGSGTTVVAYDQAMTGGAARLWWLLRHHGFDAVAVLDGGIAAWDGPLREGDEPVAPGDVALGPPRDDVLDAAELLASARERIVVDVRAPERFRGELEPVDPVAGHLPGARNVPLQHAFDPPAELLASDREIVAYCGSGVSACVLLLGLAAAGRRDAKLYPGSWSDWVARGLPVERGAGASPSDGGG